VPASFTGTHHQKVDAKGRVSIPAELRRELERGDEEWKSDEASRLYLVFGENLDRNIQGYSAEEFGKLMDRIRAIPRSDPRRDLYDEYVIGASTVVSVDKDGRAILNKQMREKLRVEQGGDLRFRGRLDHFEIWRTDIHDEVRRSAVAEKLAQAGGVGTDLLAMLPEI